MTTAVHPKQLPLLPASYGKFLALSIATFLLYTLYWIFRVWLSISRLEGKPNNAGIRTLFSPFIAWSAFHRLRLAVGDQAETPPVPLEFLGGLWGLMVLSPKLLPQMPLAAAALVVASPLVLLPVLSFVNTVTLDTGAPAPGLANLTRIELLAMVGGLFGWLSLLL
jgi:hypothetical protein